MGNFIGIVAAIYILFCAIVGAHTLFFGQAEKRECEKNLPRHVECVWAPPADNGEGGQ